MSVRRRSADLDKVCKEHLHPILSGPLFGESSFPAVHSSTRIIGTNGSSGFSRSLAIEISVSFTLKVYSTFSMFSPVADEQCSAADVTRYSRQATGREGWIEHDSSSRNGHAICCEKYSRSAAEYFSGSDLEADSSLSKTIYGRAFRSVGKPLFYHGPPFFRHSFNDVMQVERFGFRHRHHLPAARSAAGFAGY